MPPTITSLQLPRISANRYARNGSMVSVNAVNTLISGANQVLKYRTRELASFGGVIADVVSAGVGPTVLHRGRSRTSPWCARLKWHATIYKTSPDSQDPYVFIEFYDSSGGLVTSVEAHGGMVSGSGMPDTWQDVSGSIAYDALEDVEVRVTGYNNVKVLNATVWELSRDTSIANGYLMPVVGGGPILDSQRDAMAIALASMLTEGGAHVLNWTGSRTASVTSTNIVDGSSTTVTAATPGFTLDLRYKARVSQAATGVPVTIYAWGQTPTAADGTLRVKDSTGATVATLTGFTTGGGWRTTTCLLPATLAKYDLQLQRTTNNTVVSAVSIFELD